jgi:hypothetical protein
VLITLWIRRRSTRAFRTTLLRGALRSLSRRRLLQPSCAWMCTGHSTRVPGSRREVSLPVRWIRSDGFEQTSEGDAQQRLLCPMNLPGRLQDCRMADTGEARRRTADECASRLAFTTAILNDGRSFHSPQTEPDIDSCGSCRESCATGGRSTASMEATVSVGGDRRDPSRPAFHSPGRTDYQERSALLQRGIGWWADNP